MLRIVLALALIFGVEPSSAFIRGGLTTPTIGTGGAFVQLSIGAGGVVSHMAISSDGKQFIGTDTAGVDGRLSHSNKFTPSITSATMPVGDIVPGNGGAGACAVAIAPSNTSHWYMYFAPAVLGNNTTSPAYVYSSTNNGATWVRTTNQPSSNGCNANNHGTPPSSVNNPYLDVSPANDNAVYLGTPSNGVFYTLNGGSSAWSSISTATIPAATQGMGNLIHFDPSDVTGNTVYITSSGTGVYKCTAALSTPSCAILNTSGMPTSTFKDLYVDPLGTVWVTGGNGDGTGNVYRYLSGTWSLQITGSFAAVATDPAATSNVYVLHANGSIQYSTNGQAGSPTWTVVATTNSTCSGGTTAVLSTVVPWQQWVNDCFLDGIALAFDSSQSHVLYMGNGDGVYKIIPPTSGSAAIQWNADETAGIENIDLTSGMALVGGGLGFGAQDRPLWFTTTPLTYPSQFYPNSSGGTTTKIRWGTNLCGNAAANTYAGLNNTDGFVYSTTGFGGTYSTSGQTGLPGGSAAGFCAILTSTNWVWFPNQGQGPYFTNNSGSSWTACTFGGGKTAGGGGWSGFAQDSTSPGTLVIGNNGSGGTNGAGATGVWESNSTTACAFTQNSTSIPSGLLTTIIALPGVACNFAYTVGADVGQALPNFGNIYLTTNCGVSFSAALSKVSSSIAMGFGKANPSHDGFPALYCQCYADDGSGSKFGFFQLDNTDTITTPIVTNLDAAQGGYPAGNLDHLAFVVGDLATYGVIYGGYFQSGGFYRTP